MYRLMYYIVIAGAALLFLFNAPLLNLVGWAYSTGGGSILTKIHPSFYLFFIGAGVSLFFGQRRSWALVMTPRFIVYLIAVLALLGRAIFITLAGKNEGELSSIIDTFLTPLFLLICLYVINPPDLTKIGMALRIFFVCNSLMGLVERLVGFRFIPSFLDQYINQDRAAAMLGHPLNAALLTGTLIVYLTTATQTRTRMSLRVPELLLHTLAMFAYGGRSALVFTVAVVLLGSIMVRQEAGGPKVGMAQRLLPFFIIIAGVGLVFLPIPFIDATLDRFTNDTGSSQTRDSALQVLGMLSFDQLMTGINVTQRETFMTFFNTPAGFEVSWIALTVTYGLLATIPMMIGLPTLLFGTARPLDRSAFYIAVLFMIVTIGSLSLGSKSLLLSQTLILMLVLTQRGNLAIGRSAIDGRGQARQSVLPQPRP
ncbi:MAG: VpsF family polysaccharide biosynthesis protein [Pseudomonadota bacterium]|tara:strand:+ start:2260 stop:3537 length:1278 start_codon:yes stop_codon:yes gene_type:complete